MNGQLRPTIAQQRHLAARREAIHAAERAAYRPPVTPPKPAGMTGKQIAVAAIVWGAFFAGALWLASHDPWFLSDAVERLLGGAA